MRTGYTASTARVAAAHRRASHVCYTLASDAGNRDAGRDSEARAVQGGGGLRSCEGAAVRAAVVGGGVPGSRVREERGRAARLPARGRRAGAADQAPAAGRRTDARRRAAAARGRERAGGG